MRTKIILAAIGWISASVLLIIFLIIPSCMNITNARSKLQQQNDLIAANNARLDQIMQFKQYLNNYETKLTGLNNAYVNEKNPTAFIAFLNQTAAATNVMIQILSTNLEEQKQPLLDFQIKVGGDFAAIVRFIKIIESGSYLVNITNVSMSSADNQISSSSLNSNNSMDLSLLPPGGISALITLTAYTSNEKK